MLLPSVLVHGFWRPLQAYDPFKKKRVGGLRTEISTCMSEVLTLAVEALVPLRHKAVNSCLVKFPALRCEPILQVLLDVVVRGESFAPQCVYRGSKMA